MSEKEHNEKNLKDLLTSKNYENGIFDKSPIKGKYEWNMPGKKRVNINERTGN